METKGKASSSDCFWNKIESEYGEIPNLVKLILDINGFNSFLALKGIRCDDKQEFFQSLELTVIEFLGSEGESILKAEFEAEIAAQYQSSVNFRLKPGHRNYILNLMLQIEKIDANDFFGKQISEMSPIKTVYKSKNEYIQVPPLHFAKKENKSESYMQLNSLDHGYSRDEEEQEDYEFDEEYLTDEMDMGSYETFKVEYDANENQETKRRSSRSTASNSKRRPEYMYNDEFMAKQINPRRRRVTLNKNYPPTDEGIKERFGDLIKQSMECILPSEKLKQVANVQLNIEKESDASWAVYCPLCHTRIRLPVVKENGGRYCNYKRSNFERHLRFKHPNKKDAYETVELEVETIDESNMVFPD
ncbi:CLUMA_CG008152, isoform A [Clunio marinus]|uniref:CLUMA_CG008152, isoform A n=1 Tax=Clunio marinus TaxID=568069 RepID=A0A1J1I4Y3_9DIPT|nr:CLUMA_CG008152, isoform A [Clunio marinus]